MTEPLLIDASRSQLISSLLQNLAIGFSQLNAGDQEIKKIIIEFNLLRGNLTNFPADKATNIFNKALFLLQGYQSKEEKGLVKNLSETIQVAQEELNHLLLTEKLKHKTASQLLNFANYFNSLAILF